MSGDGIKHRVGKNMEDGTPNRYPHSELTGRIIACAHTIHKAMRPGLDERFYERALVVEFGYQNIAYAQQNEYPVHYREHYLGKLIPDLVVEEKVIVDAKVVDCFNETHISQMLGYLSITGLEIGLLINFKHARLEVKRVARIHRHDPQQPPHLLSPEDPPA